MKNYGSSALSEFLGDNITYRNLVPVDPSIPGLPDIWEEAGLSTNRIPRKTTAEYAGVVALILKYIARQTNPGSAIKRVIFIGDTHLNDGMAFQNICRAGDWDGMAFIAAESIEPVQFEVEEKHPGKIVVANRWSALDQFKDTCAQLNFPIDGQAAVLIDLDKTALGARGRNDKVIDRVRIDAATQTIRELLGDDFDPQVFSTAYQCLNQPEFHTFTADNQDYLVYICMILGGGLTSLEALVEDVADGRMATFHQFLRYSEENKKNLPFKLGRVHDDFFSLVNKGDPTPFKKFRQEEFKQTVSRMGHMPAGIPVEELLQVEITITQEVRQAALEWREQGALLFGLSDKPDEASIPTLDLTSRGYAAIHRVKTDIVGE
ncbi:MAG: hypothetical protein ACK2UM_09425 [Anaerolineales bacterium]